MPAPPFIREYVENEWYGLKEILSRYNISESALNVAVKRFKVPKHKIWRTVFYPQDLIDKIFTTQSKN